MIAYFQSLGEAVISVASSGIAALLLKNGITAHSRFKIPIKIHEDSVCSIGLQSKEAENIRQSKIIIWDEAPMAHKFCFHSVDRLLRDIMKSVHPSLANVPFGGKKIVLGGDFRQCLPVVIRGNRADIVFASVKSSYLWNYVQTFTLSINMRLSSESNTNYAQFLINVGNGTQTTSTIDDHNDYITIPENMWMPLNQNNLFSTIYDDFSLNYSNPEYIEKRSILCPLNLQTDDINKLATSFLPGLSTIYLSIDSILDDNQNNNLFFNTEYLNSLQISGLPNHSLELKVNQPIILIRNLSNSNGLCNGTRLMIKK